MSNSQSVSRRLAELRLNRSTLDTLENVQDTSIWQSDFPDFQEVQFQICPNALSEFVGIRHRLPVACVIASSEKGVCGMRKKREREKRGYFARVCVTSVQMVHVDGRVPREPHNDW